MDQSECESESERERHHVTLGPRFWKGARPEGKKNTRTQDWSEKNRIFFLFNEKKLDSSLGYKRDVCDGLVTSRP